jgi:hypothetical protein
MNTTDTTLLTSWSKDISFMKREIADLEWLRFIENSPDVSKETKAQVRAWKKTFVEGRYANITYKLGKNIKSSDEMVGRLCALKGIGLQCFPREVRAALAHRNYWDVDMVAAQPTLCLQLCKQRGLVCVKQEEFLENRKALTDTLTDGKVQVTALYFGGGCTNLSPFFQELHAELTLVRKTLVEDPAWASSLKFLNGKGNRQGKALAYILQTHERNCLIELENSCARHQRSLDTYIHDGGLVRKKEGETEFPEDLLRVFEAEMFEKTGFQMSLVSKPMVVEWVLDAVSNTAYLERKELFEQTNFKLMHPSVYGVTDGLNLYFKGLNEMTHCHANLFVDDKKFLPQWIEDPNIRTYKRLAFAPDGKLDDDEYNLFTGFATVPLQGDFSAYTELTALMGNGDPISVEYIENWTAHILQKPCEKPGVCLVLKGGKGVGKDTYGDSIGKILGTGSFWNTTSPENDVFSKFNGCVERSLLIKFEEANFETNKDNVDRLKGIVTCETNTCTRKGHDSIVLPSYSRFIFTTNHDVPCVVDDKERRFAMFEVSNQRQGDFAFWKRMHKQLAEQRSAYMYHLLNKDISSFDARAFPETEYLKDVRRTFIPHHAKWFRRMLELHEGQDAFEYGAFDLLSRMNANDWSKFKYNPTSLGRCLRPYVETGTITKDKTSRITYSFTREGMTTYLKGLGHWEEVE